MPRTKSIARKERGKNTVLNDPPPPDFQLKVAELTRRQISEGRPVLADKLGYHTETVFRALNWETFLHTQLPLAPHLIHEFYASFHFNLSTGLITVYLQGNLYEWDLAVFGRILSIPSEGREFYTDRHCLSTLPNDISRSEIVRTICKPSTPPSLTKLTINHLLPDVRAWNVVIDNNVYGKDGNRQNVLASQAYLLFCLKTHTPVNLAYFLARRMSGLVTNKKRNLPYGMLLTKLFMELDLDLGYTIPCSNPPIDGSSVRQPGQSSRSRRPRPRSPSRSGDDSGSGAADMDADDDPTDAANVEDDRPVTYREFRAFQRETRSSFNSLQRESRSSFDSLQTSVQTIIDMLGKQKASGSGSGFESESDSL